MLRAGGRVRVVSGVLGRLHAQRKGVFPRFLERRGWLSPAEAEQAAKQAEQAARRERDALEARVPDLEAKLRG
jgi:hypothetical protein